MQESTFNVKRARLIQLISTFTFVGLIFYLDFVNAIGIQTAVVFLLAVTIVTSLTTYGLRKYRKEQKEKQERLREIREKHRMQKEIATLKAELKKQKSELT